MDKKRITYLNYTFIVLDIFLLNKDYSETSEPEETSFSWGISF